MVYHQESRTSGESSKLESRFSGPYRVVGVINEGKTYTLWHPQTGKEWSVNVDRIKAFDPWENYETNLKSRPVFFDSQGAQSLDVECPIVTIGDSVSNVRQENEQLLEEERLRLLTKYNTIIASRGVMRKPRGIIAARNWKGEWIPYNDDASFEVIQILDRREANTKGTYEWLTQWKGDWLPTWEKIDLFQDNATTGMGVVWQEFERKHPYAANVKKPGVIGTAQRKR
jgi:hypothetical protein